MDSRHTYEDFFREGPSESINAIKINATKVITFTKPEEPANPPLVAIHDVSATGSKDGKPARGADAWEAKGKKAIERADSASRNKLKKQLGPDRLSRHDEISSEQDVNYAFLTYFLAPVNWTLLTVLGLGITIQAEHSSPSGSGKYPNRCDLLYGLKDEGRPTQTAAVVEFKRLGHIKDSEFMKGLQDISKDRGEQELVDDIISKTDYKFTVLITFHRYNPLSGSSRPIHSSDSSGSSSSSVSSGPSDRTEPTAGEVCRMTIISQMQYQQLPRILLGFLEEAIKDASKG
ncbi:hypothetical protein F5Y17DRAFT_462700 [Xylariaceae sp. FL0594]|nr:hypothetical protein F5Y17DRAFT_462700 [Xylariaceae sp. FL0594]